MVAKMSLASWLVSIKIVSELTVLRIARDMEIDTSYLIVQNYL